MLLLPLVQQHLDAAAAAFEAERISRLQQELLNMWQVRGWLLLLLPLQCNGTSHAQHFYCCLYAMFQLVSTYKASCLGW
jgi:hypothetical protein